MKKIVLAFCLLSSVVIQPYTRVALDPIGTLGAVGAAVTSMSCNTGIAHNASTPEMVVGIGLGFANCYGGAIIAHAIKDRMFKQGVVGTGICAASILGMKLNNGTLPHDIARFKRKARVAYRNACSDVNSMIRA